MNESIKTKQFVDDIPALPDVVNEIIISLNDESANIDILINKIMVDPSLSTRILKIANSPFYGLSGKISSLKEACIILGSNSVKYLALAAGIINKLNKSGNAINTSKLWEHAVGTGTAARILAERKGLDYEAAFTSGLLHDIGKIVLDINYPDEYKKVMEYRASNDCFIYEAEKAVLGTTHAEMGELCARHWKLPEGITEVIRYHHAPDEANNIVMPFIVHIANIVCRTLEIGYPGDNLVPCINTAVAVNGIFNIDELAEVMPEIDSLSQTLTKLILAN